jgi:signal transduction histidine kinase
MRPNFKKAPSKVWLFVGLQWSTTFVSFILTWQRWPVAKEAQTPSLALASIALGLAVLVTFRWLHQGGWRRSLRPVELIIMTVAPVAIVAASNWWQSPYVFLLLNSVVVAAYTIGFATTIVLSLFASLMISLPYLFLGVDATGMTDQARVADSLRWSALLLFIGITSGYAVRLSARDNADEQLSITHREEVKKLQQANRLLFELHRVAQDLPVSLDTEDVVTSSFPQLDALIEHDLGAILLEQKALFASDTPDDSEWKVVAKKEHLGKTEVFVDESLPSPLKKSLSEKRTVVKGGSSRESRELGLNRRAKRGLYAPVMLRDRVVGLVALERLSEEDFNENDVEIVNNFCSALALALDNANWFGRLRTMGADEERNRIARELHDSIGQSLMFLGLSADSLIDATDKQSPLYDAMQQFRDDVREALMEMRNTLYDLRTSITPDHDIATLLKEYGERVQKRSGIKVTVNENHSRRLPVLQEKEMWRIAQEAIVNAEKHSQSNHITVTWSCSEAQAKLVVADDGIGFRVGQDGRRDSYGLVGMRERAESIDAHLQIVSQPGNGCTVTCTLGANT